MTPVRGVSPILSTEAGVTRPPQELRARNLATNPAYGKGPERAPANYKFSHFYGALASVPKLRTSAPAADGRFCKDLVMPDPRATADRYVEVATADGKQLIATETAIK